MITFEFPVFASVPFTDGLLPSLTLLKLKLDGLGAQKLSRCLTAAAQGDRDWRVRSIAYNLNHSRSAPARCRRKHHVERLVRSCIDRHWQTAHAADAEAGAAHVDL